MLTQEDYWMTQKLHHQGVYQGDIAKRLGLHRKTAAAPSSGKGRLPGHAADSDTPSSSRTWKRRIRVILYTYLADPFWIQKQEAECFALPRALDYTSVAGPHEASGQTWGELS